MMTFEQFLAPKIQLWLDDERDPDHPFIQREFGAEPGMTWVKTAWQAIAHLQRGNVESVSLDHDLGLERAGTGVDVAKWIEEQAFHGNLPRLRWRVHSQNPIGARNMRQALLNAERFWDRA